MPPDYPMPVWEMDANAAEERRRYLESVAAWTRASLPTPVVTSIVTGHAATALCEYVGTHPVDLVVMTTHGRTGLTGFMLGSVARRVVLHGNTPTLVVRPPATSAATTTPSITTH